MRFTVVLLVGAVVSVSSSNLRAPALRPEKPVAEFARDPLPPRALSGGIAHDVHRNFPYDAFSTTFKCGNPPCHGAGQTGCGCSVCPCATAPVVPVAPSCGCSVCPCVTVDPMPIAGPSTKTVGPKTGGNGNGATPIMVPHGSLPSGHLPLVVAACTTPPCGSFLETSEASTEESSIPAIVPAGTLDAGNPGMFLSVDEAAQDCPACCPRPCASTCACQAAPEPMPVAGPSTKTVGPKTGGNGDDVKPISVPHGSLPKNGQLPLVPTTCEKAPCGRSSLIEENEQPEGYVLKATGSSVTIGDSSKPESGETTSRSKATGTGKWAAPHMVKKGEIEEYTAGGWPKASQASPASPASPEAGLQAVQPAAASEQYEQRVADTTKAVKDEKEEVIHNFVNKV